MKTGKYGVAGRCKICARQAAKVVGKKYYNSNKEKILQYQQTQEAKKLNREASKRYRDHNKEKRYKSNKKWRQNNKDLITSYTNLRRANKKQAIALWADMNKIKSIYNNSSQLEIETGIKYNVHHIIPLNEDPLVCGLHTEDNLMILSKEEHILIHSSLDLLRSQYLT